MRKGKKLKSKDEAGEMAHSFREMAADLKRSHTEIVSARNLADNIMRSMGETLIVADTGLLITRVNQATLSLLQYEEHELIGKPLGSVVPEHGLSDGEINHLKDAAFISGQEKTYIRRDGSKVPMLFSSSILQGVHGEVEGAICIAQDTTERKKRERELLFANALLHTEQETSLDGILVVDEDHKIVSFNNRFVEMWGVSEEVVRSRSDDRALQSVLDNFESPDEFLDGVKHLYAHKEQKLHDELRLKDGTILDRYSAPMFGTDSEYYGRVFYFRDVTKRKQAEETLRESETLFRSLAETVSAAIYIYHGSKFIYVNPAAETITGYSHDELMAMEVWDILHPDFVEKAKEHGVLRQKGEEVPAHSETKILTKNGEARWLDITPSVIRFQGQQAILATAFDVTARKGWEDALRESEEKYRTILQSIQEGYFEVDLRGNLTFFNDSLCRIIGTPAERLIGLNNREYSDAETARKLYAAYNQVYQTGAPLEGFQHQITTRDGVQKFLESSILLKRDSTGQISGFRGTVRDITERKGWEDALRESEENYRTILQSIQEGYYEVDLRGGLTFFNDSLSRIMGTPAEKMRGLKHRAYTDPETSARMTKAFNEVFRAGKPLEGFEYEILTLEGVKKFLESSISLRRDSRGEIVGFRGTSRDITERKLAEQALHESEQRYRLLFESNPQPMWVYDLKTLFFLAVNEAAIQHYGYSRKEFLEMTILDIRPPEDIPTLLDAVSLINGESELMASSWRHSKKDGTVIDVEITSHTLMFTERRAQLVLATDITERRRAEQALRESEQRYKTLFDAATDGIVILGTEGDEAGSILAANRATAEATGYTVDELLK
ncbi:MAG TPA: PAS domain S-box protein, partial [Blastocatellia bacterium]|nr:PAS domain S-box protein [Blastocatellia bacterium]